MLISATNDPRTQVGRSLAEAATVLSISRFTPTTALLANAAYKLVLDSRDRTISYRVGFLPPVKPKAGKIQCRSQCRRRR